MKSVFVSPSKYIQGPGVIRNIQEHIGSYGQKCMLITDNIVFGLIKDYLKEKPDNFEVEIKTELFSGECTRLEIERLTEIAKDQKSEVILAAGGGKALDTGKAVACNVNASSIMLPTIAATDSPTSSIAVIYDENHVYQGALKFPANPSLVLVDTELLSQAPSRFIVAGMGDALATDFEAEACFKSGATNLHGGKCTLAGLSIAKCCYQTIMEHGIGARLAAEKKIVTPSLEKVIEANILLSGLGFENGGEAAAHAFDGSITLLPASHSSFHGERVGVGVLLQMILEDRNLSEISEHIEFYKAIGLPINLAQLGVTEISADDLKKVSARMCRPGSYVHNMPFEVTEKMVMDAIIFLDELGKKFEK